MRKSREHKSISLHARYSAFCFLFLALARARCVSRSYYPFQIHSIKRYYIRYLLRVASHLTSHLTQKGTCVHSKASASGCAYFYLGRSRYPHHTPSRDPNLQCSRTDRQSCLFPLLSRESLSAHIVVFAHIQSLPVPSLQLLQRSLFFLFPFF